MALKLNKITHGDKDSYPKEDISCLLVSPDRKKAYLGYLIHYRDESEGESPMWCVVTPSYLIEEEKTHDWIKVDSAHGELLFPCEEVEIEVGFWTYLAI